MLLHGELILKLNNYIYNCKDTLIYFVHPVATKLQIAKDVAVEGVGYVTRKMLNDGKFVTLKSELTSEKYGIRGESEDFLSLFLFSRVCGGSSASSM